MHITGELGPCLFNRTARMKYENWRHLGYSPNTAVGHGRHFGNYNDEWVQGGKKRGKKKIKDTRTVLEKVAADLYRVYRAILKSCIDCCKRGGVRAFFKGKKCMFKPFLLSTACAVISIAIEIHA